MKSKSIAQWLRETKIKIREIKPGSRPLEEAIKNNVRTRFDDIPDVKIRVKSPRAFGQRPTNS